MAGIKSNKIPYNYQAQYFVEKIPLYLREGYEDKWLKVFKQLEYSYEEYKKLNISDFGLIHSYIMDKPNKKKKIVFNNKTYYEPLSSLTIANTKAQNKLIYYWEQWKDKPEESVTINNKTKTIYWVNYNLYYYQDLVRALELSPLNIKHNWRNILNKFNLRNSIKIRVDRSDKSVHLLVSEDLDELTKKIFTDIVTIPIFKSIKIKDLPKIHLNQYITYKFNYDNRAADIANYQNQGKDLKYWVISSSVYEFSYFFHGFNRSLYEEKYD